MKTHKPFLLIGLSLLLVNCNNASHEAMDEAYVNAKEFISSSAARENQADTTHKFIRTANLKFKVNSVIESTYRIEETAVRLGGFVTLTNLVATINAVNTIPVSADSSLETKHYVVCNTITLRVPNNLLDSALKEISQNIDFLDHRIIQAQDVALEMLSNSMIQKRTAQHEARVTNAINSQGKKLTETVFSEDFLLRKKEQEDNAKLSNMALNEQINFSTVHLTLYQRETIRRELIANNKNIDAYEPGLVTKLWDAVKCGWKALEAMFVFFVRIWPLLLLVAVSFMAFKKYRNRGI